MYHIIFSSNHVEKSGDIRLDTERAVGQEILQSKIVGFTKSGANCSSCNA